MGGYFCVLLLSLPNVYPILKQAKPKLTTAIKSTILIGLALLPYGFPFGYLCNQRVTVLRSTSVVAKRVPLALCNPLGKNMKKTKIRILILCVVSYLSCFLGVKTQTALSTLVEVGDFKRFASAKQFASYLGLTPGEDSSGGDQNRL